MTTLKCEIRRSKMREAPFLNLCRKKGREGRRKQGAKEGMEVIQHHVTVSIYSAKQNSGHSPMLQVISVTFAKAVRCNFHGLCIRIRGVD